MDLTGTSAVPRSSSAATGPAGRTGRLAAWLAGTHAGGCPPPVHEHAKLTHRVISPDRQAAIEKAVLHLDTLNDVAQLTALLTPAVSSPLG